MNRAFSLLWRCAGVMGGAPCLRTTGVGVEFVASRFAAGESIAELARDYRTTEAKITEAIRLVVVVKGSSLTSKAAVARIATLVPETRRPR